MATTRTPGITVLADGRRFIDKRYLGVRIGLRVGSLTQEQAEERLRGEMARVESDLARKSHVRPTFTIRSPAVYAPLAYPPKIGKRCSATPTIRWRVITRVPTSAACSSRPTSYSIGAERRACYAWRTLTRDRLWDSNSN